MRTRSTRFLTVGLVAVLAGVLPVALTASGGPALAAGRPQHSATTATTAATATTATRHWTPRPAEYPGTVTRRDLAIPMDDGTVLRGDLMLPAGADGRAVHRRLPVVVTITAYNKSVIAGGAGSTLAGAPPAYLVRRGYAQLTVDARGTGSSEGTWCAFCTREDKDAGEVMTWAAEQPWSNGRTAMTGASYMGISQIFAAADHPKGLRAIFPQVPAGDVYRDVVASGGELDVGFIPLWLGLVTATGVIPPAVTATDPRSGVSALLAHVESAATFSGKLMVQAALGQEAAYDGPFYRQRSPLSVIDRVDVPTFLVSGEYDLFQRGTPMLFDALQRRGVPVKMITGPWDHVQGSSGAQIAKAGYGDLSELQLRWFDHYVKGMPDPTLDTDIAPMTWYEQGTGHWLTGSRWLGDDRVAGTWRLSGSATTSGRAGGLTRGTAQPGRSTLLPIPLAGLCTRSTDQWTAGLPAATKLFDGCLEDNRLNDRTGLVFETAPVRHAVALQGPIDARLYVSSPTGDGLLSVSVEDQAPDGTVHRLSGGWQVISQRKLVPAKSRYLDGRLVQPWHPFTKASRQRLAPGQVAPVDVEVFPTGARILPGHRLRVAVQAYDLPHLAPTLTEMVAALSPVVVHASARYPSGITLPLLRSKATGHPRLLGS